MSDQQLPPPPPPYGQQPPGYPVPGPRSATGKSTAALILGIFGVILCPLVLSVPAIIVGRSATKEIDASQGQLGGGTQALVGFVLGIIGTVLGAVAAAIVFAVFVFGGMIEDAFEETCSSIDGYSLEESDC